MSILIDGTQMPKPHHADGFYVYDDGTVRNLDRNRILGKAIELPTADVVEVVRCKDCKHYKFGSDEIRYCFMHDSDHLWQDGDYCSYGERREE